LRATRPVVLAGVLAILVVGGTLTAVTDPSTVSAAAARPHPVRPQLHRLRLGGVNQAALAELRRQETGARPAVLTAPYPTEAFRLLGVSWTATAQAPRIAVEVRTRAAGGWSPWRELEVDDLVAAPQGALSPIDGGTRAGTEPFYNGPSDGVQVRVDLLGGELPEDLRVDLVDPGSSAADAGVVAQPMSAAAATPAPPSIMTRTQWGADESLRNGFAGYGESIRAGFVHHTTGASDYSSAEVPGMIRAIYAYHTLTLGWSDIGYNFLVDRFGRLYEGRWGGMDQPVIGAHTGGFNTNTVGVAALGDHEQSPVPAAVLAGFGQVLGWKLGLHGQDPYGRVTLVSGGGDSNRYPAGQAVEFNVISGHRDASYTLCPGQHLYPLLPRIRSEAAAFMGRPGPLRAVPPSRLLDTRTGLGGPAGAIPAGSSRTLQVAGRGGVPATGAGTVVLNVAAVRPSAGGHLTVYPAGRARPATSNLNYPAGRPAVANLVHVALGSGGAVTIHAAVADVHVVADVYGWTSNGGASLESGEGLFQPVIPYRVLDTRSTVALGPGESRSLRVAGTGGAAGVPASGASAVILNLTVTRPTASSHLTVYPGGHSRPSTSSLNFLAGETRANRVLVPVGPDGTISIYNHAGSSHVVVDINGWYTAPGSTTGGARFVGLTPSRLEDTRGSPTGPLVNEARSYQAAGRGGVPAAGGPEVAVAVALNVTAVHAATTTGGHFTLYPADTARPLASDLNFRGNQVVPNLAVVKLSPDGRFTLASAAPDATHAVIDLLGYYTE